MAGFKVLPEEVVVPLQPVAPFPPLRCPTKESVVVVLADTAGPVRFGSSGHSVSRAWGHPWTVPTAAPGSSIQ